MPSTYGMEKVIQSSTHKTAQSWIIRGYLHDYCIQNEEHTLIKKLRGTSFSLGQKPGEQKPIIVYVPNENVDTEKLLKNTSESFTCSYNKKVVTITLGDEKIRQCIQSLNDTSFVRSGAIETYNTLLDTIYENDTYTIYEPTIELPINQWRLTQLSNRCIPLHYKKTTAKQAFNKNNSHFWKWSSGLFGLSFFTLAAGLAVGKIRLSYRTCILTVFSGLGMIGCYFKNNQYYKNTLKPLQTKYEEARSAYKQQKKIFNTFKAEMSEDYNRTEDAINEQWNSTRSLMCNYQNIHNTIITENTNLWMVFCAINRINPIDMLTLQPENLYTIDNFTTAWNQKIPRKIFNAFYPMDKFVVMNVGPQIARVQQSRFGGIADTIVGKQLTQTKWY